jgi:hypothetical protein
MTTFASQAPESVLQARGAVETDLAVAVTVERRWPATLRTARYQLEIVPHAGFGVSEAGQLAEARDVAARIMALAPADAEARGNLGSLALELGDLPSARRDLRAALALSRGGESVAIAARCVRALLAVPTDPESCVEARALAERLVGLTGGTDPLSMLMLARAQAMLADPDARATLARADALLAAAPADVREAAAAERAAAWAALQGNGMP